VKPSVAAWRPSAITIRATPANETAEPTQPRAGSLSLSTSAARIAVMAGAVAMIRLAAPAETCSDP
jgi:hypothetical protein